MSQNMFYNIFLRILEVEQRGGHRKAGTEYNSCRL